MGGEDLGCEAEGAVDKRLVQLLVAGFVHAADDERGHAGRSAEIFSKRREEVHPVSNHDPQ